VFDLCSGKGGDLTKWLKTSRPLSHYVALEYQESLTDQAIKRFKDLRITKFPAIFIVGDAGDELNTID